MPLGIVNIFPVSFVRDRLAAACEGVHAALSVADNGAASLAPLALAAHTVPFAVESMRVAADHAEAAVCEIPLVESWRGGGQQTEDR